MSKISQIVGLKELRQNTERYISEVNRGKSFTVVRRSKPIFRILPVDEWGDEGIWETVLDFTKLGYPEGISTTELLARLESRRHTSALYPVD